MQIRVPDSSSADMVQQYSIIKKLSIFALFLIVLAIPLGLNDYWISSIIIPTLIMGLAGIGLNILMGYTGCVSLGSAAFMAIGAFSAYNLLLRVPILPLPIVIILAGLIAALFGVLFGLPSMRIKGFYLAASTLGAQFFFEWLFTNFPWFCNNNLSLTITAPRLEFFGFSIKSPQTRYIFVICTTITLVLLAYSIVRSRIGREWLALSDMETSATVTGIKVNRRKLLAYAISSFYCGVAGVLWAFAYLQTSNAYSFDLDKSFEILFIVVIGGTATIAGNFLGAAFIILTPVFLNHSVSALGLTEYMNIGVTTNLQRILFGVMIIYILIKEPEGLYKLMQKIFNHIHKLFNNKSTL